MPVTRSVGRHTASASASASATVTSATATTDVTGASRTATTVTGTDETATTSVTDQSKQPAAVEPLVTEPATSAGIEDQEKNKSRTASRSKKTSKSRRLAAARAELARLKVELAAARVQEIEEDSSSEDDSATVTEVEQELRVRTWLRNSQLLAIDSEPHQATPPRADAAALAPAGVTAAHPPRPTSVEEGAPAPLLDLQAPPPATTAESWGPNSGAAHPPPAATAAPWQANPDVTHPLPTAAAAAAAWQPNTQDQQQPPPALAAWFTEQAARAPPPATTAASWRPNSGVAQPPPLVAAWLRGNEAPPQTAPWGSAAAATTDGLTAAAAANASWQQGHAAPPPQLPPPPNRTEPAAAPLAPDGQIAVPQRKTEMQQLAAAITNAVQAAQVKQTRYVELPFFNGDHQEWLTFRASYEESAHNFTNLENMSRLRRSLRGTAREAVQGLLITNADPDSVMRTLEIRFGRPESIAAAEIERLRILPRLAETPRDVCTFATKISNAVNTLRALRCIYYMYNPETARAVIEKLTPTLRHKWYEFAAVQPREEPDLSKLERFLQKEAQICSPFATAEAITSERFRAPRPEPKTRQKVFTTEVTHRPNFACVLCRKEGHAVTECARFKQASIDERWDTAKRNKLCFRCLRRRTQQHSCKTKRCDIDGCEHLHHQLLHSTRGAPRKTEEEREQVNSAWNSSVSYLKIAPVRVSGPAGVHETYALLDDGSTVTLIDEALADTIGADGPDNPLRISTYDGHTTENKTSRHVRIRIQGRGRHTQQIHARTVPDLRLAAQRISEEAIGDCPHLKDVLHTVTTSQVVPKILIGQDNWHLLIATKTRSGRRDQPVASLTPLGWVVHGSRTRSLGHHVNFVGHTAADDEIEKIVREFITADNTYVSPKRPENDPEQKALQILEANTVQLPEGGYQTALLWKSEEASLPDNYENTLRRLYGVEKKIDKNPALKGKYNAEMNKLISKGYAEPAPTTKTPGKTWYLPHFAVVNALKPEKLRVVHDAAAKTRGVSLNDMLLTGPDLLQPLPGVLMRFRERRIAVTADIAEMFMRVQLREQDRDALRYLWRGDRRDDAPPEEFRMKSLIFGASCSPATAIYTMNKNARNHEHRYPEAAAAIIRKHYMDDYLDSFDDVERAATIVNQIQEIHSAANFHLRKWKSNSPELLERIGEETENASVSFEGKSAEKVLGLTWEPQADAFQFNLDATRIPPSLLERPPTKREALKIIMSIFDPLGLITPVTIEAKQLLQEVWRNGIQWDEQLKGNLAEHWQKWIILLRKTNQITIPRLYPNYSTAERLELHVFCDASERAYATALYWRAVDRHGGVSTTLAAAKAKVAPLKLLSIPRLELQAALLGARMAAAVKKEHCRTPDATTYWTDSRTALAWIRTGARSYKSYVAHRIAAIEEITQTTEWRWVPTRWNVADDATRDVPEDFSNEHRWFRGPEFLQQDPVTWPSEESTTPPTSGEERVHNLRRVERRSVLPEATRFSNWTRYLRATARVLQAVVVFKNLITEKLHYKRTRKSPRADPEWRVNPRRGRAAEIQKPRTAPEDKFPTLPAELQKTAELLIIRNIQEDAFSVELKALEAGRTVERGSRLYRLSIQLKNGLITLKSRIDAATGVPEEAKNPPVVDGNHHATQLWIRHVHESLHHAGVEATLNQVKQSKWVIRLRPTIKTVISSCRFCRARTAAPPQPATGDLPACRLAHHRRPFTYTGLDYFGPLTVTVGRSVQKRYVALFTCLTVRAVHLEVVSSLSTESAVMALRRMIARRGCPQEIWSDNATNFRGADAEIRQTLLRGAEQEASKKTISWRFIPPGAPFMGGAWERLVRSVKTALTAVLHQRSPNEETLHTLLTEVELTLNSRPLTYVSVDPADPESLTPSHFLLGGQGHSAATSLPADHSTSPYASLRATQALADAFWARWLKEYLPELRNRREPHGRGLELQVGDLVRIVDKNLPRNTWVRGRISATYPGPDSVVRTVDVATKGGVLRRPAKKIILLHRSEEEQSPCTQ